MSTPKKFSFFIIFLVLLFSNTSTNNAAHAMSKEPTDDTLQKVRYDSLKFALDGDTLAFEELGEARLIGVDCSEMELHKKDLKRIEQNNFSETAYRTAATRAKQFIENTAKGKRVKIERDPSHRFNNGQDNNKRELIYAYVDDVFINAELIKQGLCVRQAEVHYEQYENFEKLQEEAKTNQRGIWSDKDPILL